MTATIALSGGVIPPMPGRRRASANLYSLIETAKANGIEPYAYLRTVFTKLLQATSVDEIEVLLPPQNDGEDSAPIS